VPPQSPSLTPLLIAIHKRKLDVFTRAAVAILLTRPSEPSTRIHDAEVIVRVLHTRVIPEVETIYEGDTAETRGHVAYIVLQLFSINDASELLRWATSLVCHWCEAVQVWKLSFESALQRLVRMVLLFFFFVFPD
jgi:hypothetical protein